MPKTYVQAANESRDEHRLFQREWSTEAVTGLLCEVMERHGVSRADLARRLGVTPSAITQLLDEENNHSIHALSDAFFELGQSLEFHCQPLENVTGQAPAGVFGQISFGATLEAAVYSLAATQRTAAYGGNLECSPLYSQAM
jgi:transcriptional regulator with XRE-family HTH domain